MSQNESLPRAVRRPTFALVLVFIVSLGLMALLIAYIGAMPSMASTPREAPQVPQQSCLEIQNQTQDRVLVYQWLTYTVAFTNSCGRVLENVTITDTWITEATKPSSPPPAEYNGNLVDPMGVVVSYTWAVESGAGELSVYVGTFDPGASATLVFTMGVPDVLEPNYESPKIGPSTLGNDVVIGTSTLGVEDAYDTDATLLVGPVLTLDKAVQTESGIENKERPGRLVTYTLSLRNLNADDDGRPDAWPATEVQISDNIPRDLTFIDAQPLGQWTYLASAHRITWTLPGALLPGETAHVTFTARVTTTKSNYQIRNRKDDCSAISAERLTSVRCSHVLNVLSPLEKRVETRDPPSEANFTFPGRYITYTVYVYNPLQIPVSDLRITDTLPADTSGFFEFAGMVDGGPPPISYTGTLVWNTLVWDGLSLPANGVISFTFRVYVDKQTPVTDKCRPKQYRNTLFAAASAFPVVYENDEFSFKDVKVAKQINLSKSVKPSQQFAGELVTYTIKIENVGDTSISIPIFTDTLPIAFRFHSMVSALPGQPGENENVIWWDDLPPIGAGETLEFSFRAVVDGVPLEKYKNDLGGFSPDTYICAVRAAEVGVESPIVGNKTADPPYPEPIVQGESFEYSVFYQNVSRLQSYIIDEFVDYLPLGFEPDEYVFPISPTFELQPERANSWEHTFTAQVVGEGAGTDWCNALADEGKRKKSQLKQTFGIHTTDPAAYWVNREVQAPVYIVPHVDLFQEYNPDKVGPSGTTTVTLSLVNNMRGALAQPVTDTVVTYVLRENFIYLGAVSGTPEPVLEAGNLVWYDVDLPASGTVELSFQLEAPFEAKKYKDILSFATAADPDICIPAKKVTLEVVKGVTWAKKPTPKEVGPFGTVEYNIEVKNLTAAPATGIRITDTKLPPGFEFIEMTSGHTPVSLAPLVWEIPYMEALAKENITFKVRAYVHLGPQYNSIDGIGASTYVTRAQPLEEYSRTVEVRVVPGVGLYKTVSPTLVQAGQPVTYTIRLYNGSSKNMANIVLTDTLPDGFSFGEMIEGGSPELVQGTLVVWKIDQLNISGFLDLVFRADTDPGLFDGTYYNQVAGEAWNAASPSDRIDVPSTDLTAPVNVDGPPTVQRSKSVAPSTVVAGNLVTYTITLYNETDEAHTLRLTDTLPVSITYVGVVAPTPEPIQTSPVVWDSLALGSQQTITLAFRAWVDLYARSGSYYNRLDATIDDFQLPPIPLLAPLWVDEIPRYDLRVAKSDGEVRATEGDLVVYTITYTNVNEADLTLENVVITDTFLPLPPYADPTGLNSEWGEVATNVYSYSVGTLGPNESGSVQFRLQLSTTIPLSLTQVVSNTAEIGHSTAGLAFETDPSNNHSTDLDILHGPDLVIDGIEVSPPNPRIGESIAVSVTVRNQGKDPTQHVDTSDTWFLVELYLKGTGFTPSGPPSGVFDHCGGICPGPDCIGRDPACTGGARPEYYASIAGLDGNDDATTVRFTLNVDDVGDYHAYAQADVSYGVGEDYGLIQEVVETNNVFSYGVVHVGGSNVYLPIDLRNH